MDDKTLLDDLVSSLTHRISECEKRIRNKRACGNESGAKIEEGLKYGLQTVLEYISIASSDGVTNRTPEDTK